jgi:integrase
VGHAHRVLCRALQLAVKSEILTRNVASAISPPKVEEEEIEILTAEQIDLVVRKLQGHPLYEIAMVDLDTGMRRGELLALRLSDVDLERATVRVERSLEETKGGLRFKPPKTKRGRRTITLPPNAVSPVSPNQLSWLWRAAVKSLKLPRVSFHALRHTHASALIASGQDVVMVSRRLGHKNPTVTLNTYGHLCKGGPAIAVTSREHDENTGGTEGEEIGL